MKTKKLFLLPTLIAALNLLPVGQAPAQTFKTLHSFTALPDDESPYPLNSGGAGPKGLVLSGNTLYGAASLGSSGGAGTLFAINTDGTGFTNLHDFAPPHYFAGYVPDTNSDGIYPNGLIVSGDTLYGAADRGGSGGGTLFAVNTNGTAFTNLQQFGGGFVGSSSLISSLILSGNTLYGASAGAVFALNRNGTGLTNLHQFNYNTNRDGAGTKGLILSGNTLYGTAMDGGSSSNGTVFAVNTNGTGFTTLHTFTATSGSFPDPSINSDGAGPQAGLILLGNALYGTTRIGGTSGNGTVFAVNTNGTGFRVLHSFTAISGPYPSTNSDGASPQAGLILSGNNLYGTAGVGGSAGNGSIFKLNTNGTGFTTLYSFTASSTNASGAYTNSDGAGAKGLILSGNTFYGTASSGGSGGGTVFSLSFPLPQLTIAPSGIPPSGIILSWPTNVAGFDYTGYTLQSTASLTPPVAWSDLPAAAPGYVAPMTGANKYFRLGPVQ